MTTTSHKLSNYSTIWIGRNLVRSSPGASGRSQVYGRVAALLFLIVAAAPGQAVNPYTPVSGETYEAVLNQLFAGHQTTRNTRFHITLRILPPFAAESEIDITYTMDRKGAAVLRTPSKPLRRALDDYAATGARQDIARLVSLVQVKTETFEIEGDIARGWLKGFWRSIAHLAQAGPDLALKNDGAREVEVTLDATTYQVFYSDAEIHFQISAPGPDPAWAGDLSKLDPLVKWMLEVRREIEARKAKSARGRQGE